MAPLAALGFLALVVVAMVQGRWVMAGMIGVPLAAPAVVLSVALGRESSLEHFNLICPLCRAPTRRAADFLFNKAKCPGCGHIW